MKKLKYMALLLGAAFLFSCSSNKPRDVAEDFVKAMMKGNLNQAKKCVSTESRFYVGDSEKMLKGKIPHDYTFDYIEQGGDGSICWVAYYKAPNKAKREVIFLVNEDGKWKVDADRACLMRIFLL